jgi:hypothetical protein
VPFWPFRKRSRAATSEAQPADEGAPVPAPEPQRLPDASSAPAPPARPAGAWNELAPLRPVNAGMTLTAPVQRLTDGMATHHAAPVGIGPLGHLRASDAPAGVVHGVLQPTGGSGSSAYASRSPLDVAVRPKPAEDEPVMPAVQRLRWGSGASSPALASSAATTAPAAFVPPAAAADAPAALPLPAPPPVRAVTAVDTPAPPRPDPSPAPVRAHRPGTQRVAAGAPAASAVAPAVGLGSLAPTAVGSAPGAPLPAAPPAPTSVPKAPPSAPLVGAEPLVTRPPDAAPAAGVQRLPSPDAAPVPELDHAVPPGAADADGSDAETTEAPAPQRLPEAGAPSTPIAPLVGARPVTRRRSSIGAPLAEPPSAAGRPSEPLVQRVAESAPAAAPTRVAQHPGPMPTGPITRPLVPVPVARELASAPPVVALGPSSAPTAPLASLKPLGVQRLASDEPPAEPEWTPDGVLVPARPPLRPPAEPYQPISTAVAPGVVSAVTSAPAAPVPVRRHAPGAPSARTVQRTAEGEDVRSSPDLKAIQRSPERVPADVARDLSPVLGDVSDVPVYRGPEVGSAAKQIQAKAFTTEGAVHLPDHHGPTTSGEGRDILAHEVTHAVQQRRLGSSLPSEESAEGQRLEQEAKDVAAAVTPAAAQRVAASDVATSRGPLTHPTAAPASAAVATRPTTPLSAVIAHAQRAAEASGIATVRSSPMGMTATFPPVPRLDEPGGPVHLGVSRLPVVAAPAAPPAVQRLDNVSSAASNVVQHPTVDLASPQQQRSNSAPLSSTYEESSVTDLPAPPSMPPQMSASSSTGSSMGGLSLENPQQIDELAEKLYLPLERRLRRELLRQRERAGMSTDFGR